MNLIIEHKKQSFSKALEARVEANTRKHEQNVSSYMSFMSYDPEA